ncbi:sestrin-1-like isoform X1 [Littorina saxatilis]
MSNKLFPEKRQTMLALLHTMPDLHWKSTALDNQMYMDQHNMWSSQRLGQSEYECLGSSKGKNTANDEEIDPADTTNEDKQMVFIESFLQNNRLENLHQVMGYHPRYLEAFVKTQNYLLRDDGPLPFPYRHYIALMAAARHQCVYLVRLHAQEFLLQGGDAQWLRGLEYAPQKLRNLCEVNNILAHRPWLLNKNHIEKLTRGNDTWSLSEMMQALIIIAHFHSLCSFIMGCGLAPEIDQGGCTTRNASSSGDDESEDYSSDSSVGGEMNANQVLEEDSLESLMQRMKELTESTHEEEPTQEELLKRFELVENQSSEISVPTKEKTSKKEEVLRFVTNSDFTYNDFAKRAPGLDIPTFRIQDYSWEDHAFSLANRLYSDIGNLLDDRFNIAFNLTYYTMGDIRSVDTSAFRQAIWYYIHCMYGIRHDDYDYAQVNQLLERNLKTYIKTVCCFPERITKKDYEGVMKGFKHSEKVHVNMMITEARMQAELLYALRAVNHYMT